MTEAAKPVRGPFKLLSCELARERAEELVKELGFLGICDLVHVYAETLDGAITLEGHHCIVRIKTKRAGDRAQAKWEASEQCQRMKARQAEKP